MIALATAAVIEDRLSTVGVTHTGKVGGDFGDGSVPVDGFIGTVGSAAHWSVEAVRAILVMVDSQRLFACIPLRCRMRLVTADPLDGPLIVAEPHLDPAVTFTQDARCLMPLRSDCVDACGTDRRLGSRLRLARGVGGRRCPTRGWIDGDRGGHGDLPQSLR